MVADWPAAACHLVGRPDVADAAGAAEVAAGVATTTTAAASLIVGFAAGDGTVLSPAEHPSPAAEASEQVHGSACTSLNRGFT